MTDLLVRATGAGATVVAYLALCLGIYVREQRRARAQNRRALALAGSGTGLPTLVLHGSQTGQAESLAWQTAEWLEAKGENARLCSLNQVSEADLRSAQRALFIVSTYGEGDAPDGASVFAERIMSGATPPQLPGLRFSVLALGDRQYGDFCGFGRQLDDWLSGTGAQRENERIDADNLDAAAMHAWRAQVAGDSALRPELATPQAQPWRLVAREQVNDGSQGAPLFHLAFGPASSTPFHWEAGDLAQLEVASDPTHPRDYSIASIPEQGELHLLVRQERHPDGTPGAASGFLTQTLPVGATVALRLRPHANFRLGDNATRPLLLIGNGSGLAGLRALLLRRASLGQHANWLVYGERNAAWDRPFRADLEQWHADGVLQRLDLVFSRDQAERRYVQHRLLQASDELLRWLDRGAAIYVCGSLQGMGTSVDAALRQIAGPERLNDLAVQGRYRRDVY